jgi:DNA-binding LacI/PurR family transcriptional regulator
MIRRKSNCSSAALPVTLRTVADHVGLAPCSVSAILNNSKACHSIPQPTRDRVLRAAARLNYQPNYSARSLRTKRTYTVAALASDLGQSAVAGIIAGAHEGLRRRGYCLLLSTHNHGPEAFARDFADLRQRGVEGLITMQTKPPLPAEFPLVHLNPICAYAPEPLPASLRHQLKEIGREAAEQIIWKIENRRRQNRQAPDSLEMDPIARAV